MPSKYDRVLPGLATAPVADLPYQEKVDAAKGRVRWVECVHGCRNRMLTTNEDPCCQICEALMEPTRTPVTLTDLAKFYAALRAERVRLDGLVYDVNLRLEALTQMLVASQEAGEEGWGQYGAADNALRLPSGDKFEVRPEVTGQVTDKEAYRKWCVASGYETKMQLWPTVTNAIVKERLMAGEPLPDGTEAFRRDKVVFTPMKAEKVDPAVRRVAESEVL